MTRNSNKRTKKQPRNPALDLFGEVPITWEEVYLWCERVPKIARDSWRLNYYLQNWNVPAKIRAAKLAGCFDAVIAGCD